MTTNTAEPQQKPARPKKAANPYDLPTPEKIAYGKRMRHAREVAGLSLTEAAQAMGYSQPVQLSNMENGNRFPPHQVLCKATKLYGTTMDFLCGFADDSDRDPATAALRHVTGRVTADLQRLIGTMTRVSVEAVRELMPGAADGQRMASLAIEANIALAIFAQKNPKFQDMRGASNFVNKLHMATEAATRYVLQVDRAKRLMQARAHCDLSPKVGDGIMQLDLLPVLEGVGR